MNSNRRMPSDQTVAAHDRIATAADFENLFADRLPELYWLAFLLTGESVQATSCMAACLDDCVHGMGVFIDWAYVWARRTVAKKAIALAFEAESWARDRQTPVPKFFDGCAGAEIPCEGRMEIAQVVALDTLERIVFVLYDLEEYSVEDCARLVGRTATEIREAHSRAKSQLCRAQAQYVRGAPGQDICSAPALNLPLKCAQDSDKCNEWTGI